MTRAGLVQETPTEIARQTSAQIAQRPSNLSALRPRRRIARYATTRKVTNDATTQTASTSVKSCGVSWTGVMRDLLRRSRAQRGVEEVVGHWPDGLPGLFDQGPYLPIIRIVNEPGTAGARPPRPRPPSGGLAGGGGGGPYSCAMVKM